jgi:hypothetical protein
MSSSFSFEPKEGGKRVNIMDYIKIDASTISLAAANIITIVLAIKNGWSLLVILWIYWLQSVTIGIFNFVRILTLKDFSTEDFLMNGKPLIASPASKYVTASFFAFHYGLFHFVYFIFLVIASFTAEKGVLSLSSLWLVIVSAAIFAVNHAFSFLSRFVRERKKKVNLGLAMAFPYVRIFPMHICIVFGFIVDTSVFGLVFFMTLKTLADIIAHQIEHATDSK